jgi:hypothetical protein
MPFYFPFRFALKTFLFFFSLQMLFFGMRDLGESLQRAKQGKRAGEHVSLSFSRG